MPCGDHFCEIDYINKMTPYLISLLEVELVLVRKDSNILDKDYGLLSC